MNDGSQDPFDVLKELEARFRLGAAPLPQETVQPDLWYGIAFRIGNDYLLGNMGEVEEIMPLPQMTRVPGVKHWVRGLAGSRGELFAVVDLPAFLGRESSDAGQRSRVLLVRHGEVASGLLVDEVLGMRRFEKRNWSERKEGVSREVGPVVKGIFQEESAAYGLVDIPALLTRDDFLDVRV